jgi:tetratricopeptide (TPR) repeat protein/tRNA A-37 threonylcarbamoyl transferase component Bud32
MRAGGDETNLLSLHPLPFRLAAFGLGKVDAEESARIAEHIAACEPCRTLVEMVHDDSLAVLLRQANGGGSTLDPGENLPLFEDAPADWPSGYEFLELLGRGGMSVVSKARQVGLGRVVALKQLRPDVLEGRDGIARFRREAEAIARLRHPNIVAIHDVGWRGEVPYFSMEYVEGGTLAQRFATGPIKPEAAARLVETLARAIQHAHDSGVIHRDLKPSNVLLAPDLDHPKIGDFGLAKFVEDSNRTSTGAILGTPQYMAPEQAGGDSSHVGPAADIYALGVILHEALTGRPPFQGSTVLETLELVRSLDPPPPRQIRQNIARDLETITLKCLEKSPERRYRSATELARDLRRHLDGEPIVARPVSSPERLARWARRRPWQATSLSLAILTLAGACAGTLAHNARLREEVRRTENEAEAARTQRALAENQYRAARNAIRQIIARLDEPKYAGQIRSSGLGLRRQLLEDALVFYNGAVADDTPASYAARHDKIHALMDAGYYQILIDRHDDAIPTFRRALQLLRGVEAETGPSRELWSDQADLLNKLALALSGASRIDEAVAVHRENIALAERARLADSTSNHFVDCLALSLHNLGSNLLSVGRAVEAEPPLARAAEIRRTLLRAHPEQVEFQGRLAESLINLALIHGGTGKFDRAESETAEAAALLDPIVREHPERTLEALSLAKLQLNAGMIALTMGKLELAIERLRRGQASADALLRKLPDWPEASQTLGQLTGALAYVLSIAGRDREAIPLWEKAIPLASPSALANYRLGRAASLAREARPLEALVEAETIGHGSQALSGMDFYNLACVAAIVAGAAEISGPRDFAERATDRALSWLEEARLRGIFSDPRKVTSLRNDEDFAALRRGAWFPLFLLDLAFPSNPFPPDR